MRRSRKHAWRAPNLKNKSIIHTPAEYKSELKKLLESFASKKEPMKGVEEQKEPLSARIYKSMFNRPGDLGGLALEYSFDMINI